MKKKILVFSPYYFPHIGGLEVYTNELNKYLASQGYSLTLVTTNLPESKTEEFLDGVQIYRIPSFEVIPNFPLPKIFDKDTKKITDIILNNDYDLVVSHTRFFVNSLMALAYAKKKKVKWLHIEHGSDFVKLNNKLYSFIAWLYDQTLGRLVLRSSNVNVGVSKAVRDFVSMFDKREMKIVNFGLNKNNPLFNSSATNKPNKQPVVIFIGRLIDGKGVDLLVRAAAKIKNKAKAKYIIVGDGPQKQNLEKLSTDLGVNDIFDFVGFKEHDAAMKTLLSSDIFVLPSYTEGLSVTMLEAAFCKKTIISTDVGGAPEVISNNKNGILIKPGNVNQLAKALEEVINDKKKRDSFSKNIFDDTLNKYSWDASFSKLIKIIEGL